MKFSDLIPIFVAIIAALPGLISSLSTIIQNRGQKSTVPNGDKYLKISRIKRIPIEAKEWKKIRKKYIAYNVFVPLVIGLPLSTLLVVDGFLNFIDYKVMIISAVIDYATYILAFYLSLLGLINLGKNPDEGRYLLFEKAEIVIDANYEEVFNHINLVFLSMRAVTIETDRSRKTLEAYVGSRLSYNVISVTILSLADETQLVQVAYKKYSIWKYLVTKEYAADIEKGSNFVNQFINFNSLDLKAVVSKSLTKVKKASRVDHLMKRS